MGFVVQRPIDACVGCSYAASMMVALLFVAERGATKCRFTTALLSLEIQLAHKQICVIPNSKKL